MRRTAWILVLAATTGCSGGADEDPATLEAQRFLPFTDGVVRDGRSGLFWTAHDSAAELPWSAAEAHCRQLVVTSGSGVGATSWRLPTSEELMAIYDETQDQACGADRCRLDPAVDLSSPYQWSSTARGDEGARRVYVDLRHGSELSPLLRPALVRRALCVGDRTSRPR